MRDKPYIHEADRESLNSAAGAYRLHRACITLSADFPVFTAEVKTLADLQVTPGVALFVHEYAHYLQNFGTVAGLGELLLWSYILGAYSRTVSSPTGEVLGAATSNDADLVRECVENLDRLQGDKAAPVAGKVRFRGAHVEPVQINLNGVKASYPQTVLEFQTETHAVVTVRAGTRFLYEGLAYALESWVADAVEDKDANMEPPPFFPYGVLQDVAQGFGVQHRFTFVSLATLALNTRFPWPTLLDLFERYRREAPTPVRIHDFVARQALRLKPERDGLVGEFLLVELPALREMFADRGAVAVGMNSLIDDAVRILTRRLNEPLFEVGAFTTNSLDFSKLKLLLLHHPPCDVLQERPGVHDLVGRDELITFRESAAEPTEDEVTYSEGVRAVEAQLSNMMTHVAAGGFVLTSSLEYRVERTCCPFFSACPLQRRRDHEDVCRDAPWSHYAREPGLSCWYSAGVAGTLGHVRVLRVLREDNQ
jgi:hypothetical protein